MQPNQHKTIAWFTIHSSACYRNYIHSSACYDWPGDTSPVWVSKRGSWGISKHNLDERKMVGDVVSKKSAHLAFNVTWNITAPEKKSTLPPSSSSGPVSRTQSLLLKFGSLHTWQGTRTAQSILILKCDHFAHMPVCPWRGALRISTVMSFGKWIFILQVYGTLENGAGKQIECAETQLLRNPWNISKEAKLLINWNQNKCEIINFISCLWGRARDRGNALNASCYLVKGKPLGNKCLKVSTKTQHAFGA